MAESLRSSGRNSTPPQCCHFAKFYREESDLLRTLAEFVVGGLDNGEAVVVMSTKRHWKKLRDSLPEHGLSSDTYIDRGQLAFVDAVQVRRDLTTGEGLSRETFEDLVGERTEQFIEEWQNVRIFGELVELLARDGKIKHLKRFEELWTEYFGNRTQTMCGYRLETFGAPDDDDNFRAVCQRHQEVVPAGEQNRGKDIAALQRETVALSSAVDEHEQTEAELEETVERERERNRRKDEFLGMLAHELRNPLASMLNAVHLMDAQENDAFAHERAVIGRQLEHMVRLVDDLLDISRISRGDIDMERKHVDVGEVVDQAIEASRPTIEDNDHQLHISRSNQPTVVEGDFDRLIQVVSNLLTNAAKYTPVGGDIWLDIDRVVDTVEIRIRDNGMGLEPEDLRKIFDLFYRTDDLDPDEGGLGVGLALVRQIVERHGGSIDAESNGAGRGSEFIVRLPHSEAPGDDPDPSRGSDRHEEPEARVLLVDDNRDLTKMVRRLLEEFGHQVRVAHGGASALEAQESFEADVALIDLNMPGMSGDELAGRLKEREGSNSEMRLVALTGYGKQSPQFREGHEMFDEYVVKPVGPDKLQGLLSPSDDESAV